MLLWTTYTICQPDQSPTSIELENHNNLKYRYTRCIDIVKSLYEKIIDLDHHFSSLQTQQNIAQLSNPLQYPEFKQTREVIDKQLKKKYAFQLPNTLESNPFIAGAHSLIGILLGSGNQKDKETDLAQISCILDFTMRMNSDLNIIFYETTYLKDANLEMKQDCEKLFKECVSILGYSESLETCRREDDWENLRILLDEHISIMNTMEGNPDLQTKGLDRKRIDLQFSIDRVIQFINSYNQFIKQGNKHYNKFNTIIEQYEENSQCIKTMPVQFEKLKNDIQRSIDKFNYAYNLPEISGSELKTLMYGRVEFRP
jgi:hypothetical protein